MAESSERKSKRKSKPRVTAFVLDLDRAQASDDGMTVPPLPGLWRNDVAIHPDALGLTLAEMREAVDALSLPLKEVKVPESRAMTAFERPDYLLPSAPLALRGVDPARDDVPAVDEQTADQTDEDEESEVDPEELETTQLDDAVADETGGSE